jgi:hypothetical protein
MSHKSTGLIFLAAAIFAFAARFLNAMIYSLGRGILRIDLVRYLFEYLDQGLWRLSIIALSFAAIYYIWSLIRNISRKSGSSNELPVRRDYSPSQGMSL